MDMTRLQQLQQFFRDDPKDPFNIYALALEYVKHDQDQARRYFEILLKEHTQYVPTYYQAAKLFEQMGDLDAALRTLEKGMEVARNNNDRKTENELRSAYDELTF